MVPVLLFVFLKSSLCHTVPKCETCEHGWEYWDISGDGVDNGLCYYWSILRKNWTEAGDFCQREGGHLASSEALATVRNIVQGMEDRGIALLWLGATDVEEEGNWTWVDGTPFQGWAWGPFEPDNLGDNEDCLTSSAALEYYWNDVICAHETEFLCSKNPCS